MLEEANKMSFKHFKNHILLELFMMFNIEGKSKALPLPPFRRQWGEKV
jgi:hypothetical protein